MGDADEDILVIGDAVKRPQFTIRGLMLLVLAVAAVAWAMRQPGSKEVLLKHWPLIAMALPPLFGLAWSIRRVYRVTPQKQTLSIVCLIISTLGLLAVVLVYEMFVFRPVINY
jgi:hypothetical protein